MEHAARPGDDQTAEIDRLIETLLTDRSKLAAVDIAELRGLVDDGTVTLLDVRPELEYRQGHIVGARSIPVAELERRLAEVPNDREVVAYCRGRFASAQRRRASSCNAKGYQVQRFAGGFPEWRAAGLAVEASAAIALEQRD